MLVIDDNRDAASTVAMLLRAMGHEALAVYDAPAALANVIAFQPDVVLIDLVMPEMDGIELARRIRELDGVNRIRVVALSAFGQEAFREATDAAGFDGHLAKPASAADLARVL